jgi:threonine dehydrogenase-like Zn-dependent dehydrogenase
MAAIMRAARLHQAGQPMRIDEIPLPDIGPRDVLVKVKACGVIPNMNAIFSGALWNHLPPLPASVGLDTSGVVAQLGSEVANVAVGERVYVNPFLSCGACHYCVSGKPILCAQWALQGYFGSLPQSQQLLARYPYGGFADYIPAAADRLVKLPASVSFAQGARFGYLGTAFAGLQAGQVGAGSWVMINGITGTLGVGATLLALGMGASRILGVGRNQAVLAQLRALAPGRIVTLALGEAEIGDWVRAHTDGLGADMLLDCSARAAPASTTLAAIEALKHGGVAVNIGALTEKLALNPFQFMNRATQFRGSNWFTTAQGQIMAETAGAGVIDLSVWQTHAYGLDAVQDALDFIKTRPGGFTNVVVCPDGDG